MKLSLKIALLILLSISTMQAQVGIGTTNPDPSSILEVNSSNQGVLLPRVALSSIFDTTTIIGNEALGLLIYNTTNSVSISEGFYYWNGINWVGLDNKNNWKLDGNDSTNDLIDFLGTTDNQDLVLKTNNTEVLRLTSPDVNNHPKVIAGNGANKGTINSPLYSLSNDNDTGIWSDNNDELSIGAGSREFLTLYENSTFNELVINSRGNAIDFRVESSISEHLFYTDGSNNRVGVLTNTPQTEFNIAGGNSKVRIDAFSAVNNASNSGNNKAIVHADANGTLFLSSSTPSSSSGPNIAIDIPSLASSQSDIVSTPNEGLIALKLTNDNLTITQQSIIQVSYVLSCNITDHNGSGISDGAPRVYGAFVRVNYTSDIAYNSSFYSSTEGNNSLTGNGYLNGNGFISLNPGTYEFELFGFVNGGNNGVLGEFGGSGVDDFKVIIHN